MSRLLEVLRKKQQDEGLSDTAFAQKLRVSQSSLSLIYDGKREVGVRLLRRILKAYPDMAFVVHEYVSHDTETEPSVN